MTSRLTDTSPRSAALIAGIGYVVIFLMAFFANFGVREGLVETGDAAATFANIVDSESLFRLGLIAFLVVFVVDVVVAWALYVLFKAVQRDLSLLTAWFRLVYTTMLGVAAVFFFVALQLVSGADYLGAFDQGQLDAQTLLAVDAFNYAWLIGLVCFGFHLMLLGYLLFASGTGPRIIAVLLAIAGVAYVVDTVAHGVLSNYDDYETLFLVIVAVPSVIGELAFTIWLLARGGKEQPALA